MSINRIISAVILMTTLATSATALNSNTLAQLDSLFSEFDQPDAPGASVMVIHRGKPVFARGYGLANLETRTPCTPFGKILSKGEDF